MERGIEISWNMFEMTTILGQGAYGDIYKVKCLESTSIGDACGERVMIDEKSSKKIKNEMTMKGGVHKPN